MSRKIEFAIVTSPRKPLYLHDAISSLMDTGFFQSPENLPLRLICGRKFQANDPELLAYRGNSQFTVEENVERGLPFGSIYSERPSAGPQRDLCINHRRGVLRLFTSDSTHLCIFEDDVKFPVGWLKRLHETIDDIEKSYGDRWVMTLFVRNSAEPLEKMREGRKWYPYLKRPYVGTQGIVYPRGVAREISDAVLERCILYYEHPIDELLGYWLDENQIDMLASAPCLVQHIGDVSTMEHGYMVTEGFVDQIEPTL